MPTWGSRTGRSTRCPRGGSNGERLTRAMEKRVHAAGLRHDGGAPLGSPSYTSWHPASYAGRCLPLLTRCSEGLLAVARRHPLHTAASPRLSSPLTGCRGLPGAHALPHEPAGNTAVYTVASTLPVLATAAVLAVALNRGVAGTCYAASSSFPFTLSVVTVGPGVALAAGSGRGPVQLLRAGLGRAGALVARRPDGPRWRRSSSRPSGG